MYFKYEADRFGLYQSPSPSAQYDQSPQFELDLLQQPQPESAFGFQQQIPQQQHQPTYHHSFDGAHAAHSGLHLQPAAPANDPAAGTDAFRINSTASSQPRYTSLPHSIVPVKRAFGDAWTSSSGAMAAVAATAAAPAAASRSASIRFPSSSSLQDRGIDSQFTGHDTAGQDVQMEDPSEQPPVVANLIARFEGSRCDRPPPAPRLRRIATEPVNVSNNNSVYSASGPVASYSLPATAMAGFSTSSAPPHYSQQYQQPNLQPRHLSAPVYNQPQPHQPQHPQYMHFQSMDTMSSPQTGPHQPLQHHQSHPILSTASAPSATPGGAYAGINAAPREPQNPFYVFTGGGGSKSRSRGRSIATSPLASPAVSATAAASSSAAAAAAASAASATYATSASSTYPTGPIGSTATTASPDYFPLCSTQSTYPEPATRSFHHFDNSLESTPHHNQPIRQHRASPYSVGGRRDSMQHNITSGFASPADLNVASSDKFMHLNPFASSQTCTDRLGDPYNAGQATSAYAKRSFGTPGSTPGFSTWKPPLPPTPLPKQLHGVQNKDRNAMTTATRARNDENRPGLRQQSWLHSPQVKGEPVCSPGFTSEPCFSPQVNLTPSFPTAFASGRVSQSVDAAQQRHPTAAAMAAFGTTSAQQGSMMNLASAAASTAADIVSSSPLPGRPEGPAKVLREQVPAEAWEVFRPTIRKLYIEERRPLKEVIQIMADQYAFQATPKMYKTRFSQWGFVKNNTEEEVKKLLSMKFQRDAKGKVSEFVRNGRIVNLGTYLKRKGVTEYDLVDLEAPADLPEYIRCRTPTPPMVMDYLQSPDLLRAQETIVANMRKAFLHCRQFEAETQTVIGWATTMHWGAWSSELLARANRIFESRDADSGGTCVMVAFKQLEEDLRLLTPQAMIELLQAMVGREAGVTTALCKYLAAYLTTHFERSSPLRQVFTCIYEVQQKHGPGTLSALVRGCATPIADELEAVYSRSHPYVVRNWADLATAFGNVTDPGRLSRLADELGPLRAAAMARAEYESSAGAGGDAAMDVMVLRYAALQLYWSAGPGSCATRTAAKELWSAMKAAGLVYPLRPAAGDPDGGSYCYHCAVKVGPEAKRCRERYEPILAALRNHCAVRVVPYFEEEPHGPEHEHAPDSSQALAAAVNYASMSLFTRI